jgi:hypothetical protein
MEAISFPELVHHIHKITVIFDKNLQICYASDSSGLIKDFREHFRNSPTQTPVST